MVFVLHDLTKIYQQVKYVIYTSKYALQNLNYLST